jgi:hypothetical protein
MGDTKNIFISHVHEDDALIPSLKQLISRAGMDCRDGSINSNNPNHAHDEQYIKNEILKPRIGWASTLIVLITHDTAESDLVNWEIQCAVQSGKRVIGVFAQGATDADIPDGLRNCGDAAVVGWRGDRVVDAINGNIRDWDDPQTGELRSPGWKINRYSC